MATTTFFIIRHGQTDWNKEGRMMGVTDIPLNKTGIHQATIVGEYLQTIPLEIIVTSPLQRAVQTAQIIQKHHRGTPLKKIHRLHERNFGILEGKTYEEANSMYPQIVLGKMWQYPDFQPPQGESLRHVSHRARQVIQHLLRHYEGKHIAVITHGSFIRNFIATFLNIPLEHANEYGFINTSLSIMRYSPTHGAEAHIINSVSSKR
jgi:broad specificity phosphatase PhoE